MFVQPNNHDVKMDKIKNEPGKFLFPILLLVTGLYTFIIAIVNNQNGLFFAASLAVLAAGTVSLLYAFDKIAKSMQQGLVAGLAVLCALFIYLDYQSVSSDLDNIARKKVVDTSVIQRMVDIRTAQLAHKEVTLDYAPTLDSLVRFIKEGELPIVKAIGTVPDTLSELEALDLGIIVRDTLYVSVLKAIFTESNDQADRTLPFNLDSFAYSPFSKEQFIMETGMIQKSAGARVPVFILKDPRPFNPRPFNPYDTLMVGSLTDASTNGNWKGE
ncbi:MAG: hypothetical protein ACJAUV_000103 [Flavobacteriales bacterium]|jgi:hypothetical protein